MFNSCCQSSWTVHSAVTKTLPRGQEDKETMLQDLGAHENQRNINNSNNTNTTNTNDTPRPWEPTPQKNALLAGELLTVESRKQRPERGERRGLLSSQHDTSDLPSTTSPLEETTRQNGAVRRSVAALGWCGAAAADETPASPAATAVGTHRGIPR